ncbi:hypothetical protein PVT67_01195 [Gallaecimonas kandeliae]|uniref:hypothetical protein n=1 Tax=Gallaecimonas kandeliae TaxID=3029055 RepID=UPI0026494BFE|nr:hypothetical protein [Gallaecimonas kandeliae]WKE65905.1 hypothetical protein PVT67_01195 [Gallaecimonas kandeliae]
MKHPFKEIEAQEQTQVTGGSLIDMIIGGGDVKPITTFKNEDGYVTSMNTEEEGGMPVYTFENGATIG